MNVLVCVVVVLFAVGGVSADPLTVWSELELQAHHDLKTLVHFIRHAVDTDGLSITTSKSKTLVSPSNTFSYKNCGNESTEIAVLSNLILKPDPIKIPGTLQVSGGIQIKSGFGSPLKTTLKIQKEALGIWVTIPCVDDIGSCTYEDLCEKIKDITCPKELVNIGLHCKCPFTTGDWTVPELDIDIKSSLPISIHGGVKIKAELSYQDKPVTCAEFQLTLA